MDHPHGKVLLGEVEIEDLVSERGRDDGEVVGFDPEVRGSHVALGGEAERSEIGKVLLEDGSQSNGSSDRGIVSKKVDVEVLDGGREDDVDLGGREMDGRALHVELDADEGGSDDR